MASDKANVANGDGRGGQGSALPSLLGQIGLILAPAGLIALFCQVLDASNRTTGATSLAAVFLTSICIYRRPINRYVPSSILTALLVALGGVFFFNYQNILLKDTGLIKWYRQSNEYLAQIDLDIAQSHQEIWFFGTDFNISAGEHRDVLLRVLSQGVNINYLVFDPKSDHLDDLAADFNQTPAELRFECEKGLASIVELQREWQNTSSTAVKPGQLQVRVFDRHPYARFYIFDPGRSEGKTYFVPYINDVNSPNVPGYLLKNVPKGVFQQYFGGIRRLGKHRRLWANIRTTLRRFISKQVARTTAFVVRVFSLTIVPAVSYSSAVSKLRRPFFPIDISSLRCGCSNAARN